MAEDKDPIETREWLDSLDEVVRNSGAERAGFLMRELGRYAMESHVRLPSSVVTPFVNTIPPVEEKSMPGDLFMERRIRSLVRWNALAMVMRANDNEDGLGRAHLQFFSSATLYDIGYNYFFRGTEGGHPVTWCFIRDTARRVCMRVLTWKGRIEESQLDNFARKSTAMACRPTPPLADAGLLAVSYGFYGAWATSGDLPGPRHEVSAKPRLA